MKYKYKLGDKVKILVDKIPMDFEIVCLIPGFNPMLTIKTYPVYVGLNNDLNVYYFEEKDVLESEGN